MAHPRTFTITLTDEVADLLRRKVASGEYASESEVVTEGLLTLADRERPLDDWLRDEVVTIYDADEADPSQTLSLDEAEAALRDEHEHPAQAL